MFPVLVIALMSLALDIKMDINMNILSRKVVPVAEIITHPSYNPATSQNDIALLKLGESVDLAAYSPACLPAQGADFAGKNGWVYGQESSCSFSFSFSSCFCFSFSFSFSPSAPDQGGE